MLFVCVRNGGKSQLAAALMRARVGERIEVHSAGTDPGSTLNADALSALREVGADPAGEHPKPVDPALLARVDLVVLLGEEVDVDPGSTPLHRWVTDEPSTRGIQGMERMRLVRDDIDRRVAELAGAILDNTVPNDDLPNDGPPNDGPERAADISR